MDMRKFFIYAFSLIIALFACDMSLFAQRLTEAQKRTLERRVEDKVNEFQFYMAQLGDKESTSVTVKNNAYGLALKLFIGEGEDYSIVRQNSRGKCCLRHSRRKWKPGWSKNIASALIKRDSAS